MTLKKAQEAARQIGEFLVGANKSSTVSIARAVEAALAKNDYTRMTESGGRYAEHVDANARDDLGVSFQEKIWSEAAGPLSLDIEILNRQVDLQEKNLRTIRENAATSIASYREGLDAAEAAIDALREQANEDRAEATRDINKLQDDLWEYETFGKVLARILKKDE
jgi:hypothetical protein